MTLKNSKRLKGKLKSMTPELKKELSRQLAIGANSVRNQAIKSMQSSPPDASRVYKRRTVTHSASKPGRPPRIDTGFLVNSILAVGSGLKYRVGTNVAYGKYLELGTSNMKARPWLRPAFLQVEDKIKNRIAKAINSELKKIGR